MKITEPKKCMCKRETGRMLKRNNPRNDKGKDERRHSYFSVDYFFTQTASIKHFHIHLF